MASRKHRAAVTDAAGRLGLGVEVSTSRRVEAKGFVSGMKVRIAVWPGGGWQTYDPGRSISIAPPNLPAGLGLSRWPSWLGWLRWLHKRPGVSRSLAQRLDRLDDRIRFGDAAWDDAFAVSTQDRESAVAYLTPERRAKILEVRDRDEMWESVQSGAVMLPWPEPTSADALVDRVVDSITFVRETFGT